MLGINQLSVVCLFAFVGIALSVAPACVEGPIILEHANPNNFWLCEDAGVPAIELSCPPDSGFLNTAINSGCVPYADWGCTPDKNVVPNCATDIIAYETPQRHYNPNKFWVCQEDRTKPPVALNCGKNTGFVSISTLLGCVPFESNAVNPNKWVCSSSGDRY